MKKITQVDLKKLYRPLKDSHKGQNGKLTIIGGSRLFHGASLWALKVASRIVDMVYYSSIPSNNKIAEKLKSQIFDFICVPRKEVKDYIEESDVVLMDPGLMRVEETKKLTKKLLFAFPKKKWVLDAGSLQMMEKEWLKKLPQVIITPHQKEFEKLFGVKGKGVEQKAKEYGCVIVLKGPTDYVCSPEKCAYNTTGNEGMTKGGTGDVLAGLIAALACKNDLFLSACAGVYLNGLAGDRLYKKVGPFY
ncbi:unnamed protein product [marine sediment metagenome]|uniref:YjeF C-terminal domain-containing protein n=1 Tax=marine sediment metagenome TaxID=412755 RepID=X1RXN6_9ZZZZ